MNEDMQTDSGPVPLEHYRGNRRHLSFDPTINAGHILTFVSMAALVATGWVSMDKRVTILEETRAFQTKRDETQDAMTRDKLNELTEAIRDLRRSIERRSDPKEK